MAASILTNGASVQPGPKANALPAAAYDAATAPNARATATDTIDRRQ
eukprot:gene24108-32701_t